MAIGAVALFTQQPHVCQSGKQNASSNSYLEDAKTADLLQAYMHTTEEVGQWQHLLMMASTRTWMGFWSVSRWTISKECLMMRTAIIFLPLFRPCCISESVTLQHPLQSQHLLQYAAHMLLIAMTSWQLL